MKANKYKLTLWLNYSFLWTKTEKEIWKYILVLLSKQPNIAIISGKIFFTLTLTLTCIDHTDFKIRLIK